LLLLVGGEDPLTQKLGVFLGSSSGALAPLPATTVPSGLGPSIGDVDGDGKPDVVMAGRGGVSVFHGVGDGTFVAGPRFSTGASAGDSVLGDFNRDGHVDIARGGALVLSRVAPSCAEP
jgi:hypothetical protein